MTQTRTWEEMVARTVEKFGYLVASCAYPRQIGQIERTMRAGKFTIGQPFRVVAEATVEEFYRQARFNRVFSETRGRYFYRVETD